MSPKTLAVLCISLSIGIADANERPRKPSPAAGVAREAAPDRSPSPRLLPEAQAGSARLLGAAWLSGARNDYNLNTDAAERLLVFARSGPDFDDSRIWFARRDGEGWREPVMAPFSDARYRDSDPWLTPDGHSLYFISNRPVEGTAPRKDTDIWRVSFDGARFSRPEHLAAVASDASELGPEVHDGWLYFNSSRAGGPAKMSIYRARIHGRGFGPPQPLAAPFNDGESQGDFTLSPDGATAVFWSERGGSSDLELFAACRIGDGWSEAVRLPAPFNATAADDFTPQFSADGRVLRFASTRKTRRTGDPPRVLNGQANLYAARAEALAAAVHRAAPSARCDRPLS